MAFPANSQALTYDLDGNLSFDGIWSYEWDGENRLISMTMTNVASIAATNRLRLEFAYDCQGRRVQKVVKHWNGGPWALDSDSRFVYDGWNLLAILDSSVLQQSFLWGQDLSGTMDRAGGVGGLIMLTSYGSSNINSFVSYDGSGDVTALLNGATGTIVARYEYSGFGELLRATGLLAYQNPLRFSTKFCDDESGNFYYGCRFYSPRVGRWTNRDSSQEQGGLNLYTFCHNNPLTRVDTLGDMDYDEVQKVQANIRRSIDNVPLKAIFGRKPISVLMFKWFFAGFGYVGDYDFGNEKHERNNETFDIGQAVISSSQAGNYFAGYAAGYAWIQSGGDSFYLAGVFGVGAFYGVADMGEAVLQRQGVVQGFRNYLDSLNWQRNGMIGGASDALFEDF